MARAFPSFSLRKLLRMRKSCGGCSLHALVDVGAGAGGSGAAGGGAASVAARPASAEASTSDGAVAEETVA
jgi:hypothetical protein